MSSTEYVSFNFIKKSVTILQVLDHYKIRESFKQKGDSLVGPCPIHGGSSTDCFRISVTKNCFNCFGKCKAGGNILDLVSKKEGVTIRKAALLIQEWFNLTSPTEPHTKQLVSEDKPEQTKAPAATDEESTTPNPPLPFVLKNLDAAHPAIAELGINAETIQTFGLGFCAKGLLTDYVAIPIHNKDCQLVAYAGRWPGAPPEGIEKYKFPSGFRKTMDVFNLHRLGEGVESGPLIVVKDCLTCIKFWQFGFRRIVAIMGNSISKTQAGLIENIMQPDRRIVVLYDETDIGRTERIQVATCLARNSFVNAPSLPSDGKLTEGLLDHEVKAFAF